MLVNRHIVVTAVIITGCGIIRYWTGQTASRVNVTRILLGGYVLVLVLSLLDLITALQPIASGLADLAAIAVLFSSGVVQWLAGLFPTVKPSEKATGVGEK